MLCCLPLEQSVDLNIFKTDIEKMKARKELWEVIAAYTAWMEEWDRLLFTEVTC